MNLSVLVIFSAVAILREYASTHPVKYDQRQEGDLNVRTDVEDVVFVVVPPQDLVAAGMGLMAATAADFFRKNYGSIGPERWPLRTPPKLGFVPLEKSPYKIDLEKSGVKVKKISHIGDPNRYSIHDGKLPTRTVPEIKPTTSTAAPEKLTMEMLTEMVDETQSTTESKTVKKVLKPEDIKMASEEKKPLKPVKPLDEKKEEKLNSEPVKKLEDLKTKTEEKPDEEFLKIIGEDGLGPDSIFRLEGCGPDLKRDSTGKCVLIETEKSKN